MGLGADTTSFGSSGGGEGTHVTADLGASTSGGVVALRISLRRRGAWRGRGNARVRWWRGGVAAGRVFVLRRGRLCHGRRGHGGKRQRWPFGWNGSSVGLGADEETRQRRRVATAERVVGRQREHRGRHGHCDREHGGGSPNLFSRGSGVGSLGSSCRWVGAQWGCRRDGGGEHVAEQRHERRRFRFKPRGVGQSSAPSRTRAPF